MSHRPNILVFMSDQQRGDVALPTHPLQPPHLRRFAVEGVQFTHAYCPAPHCCPSRASFFSGLYPSRHGIWNNVLNERARQKTLNPGIHLWSEDLAAAGYEMAYTGKWHISATERPSDRGWGELAGVNCVAGHRHGPTWEYYRSLAGQDPRSTASQRPSGHILRPGWGDIRVYGTSEDSANGAADETTVAAAEAWLRARSPDAAANDQPWCLYVGVHGPHDPYLVPASCLDRVPMENVSLPANFSDDLADRPGIYRRLREQVFGQLSPAEWRELVRHYWAYCLQVDDWFGRVLTALDASGAAGNTLVLFCSDHGDYVGDHGLLCKGIPCFEGAYHVPAVMRWPGRVTAPGRTCDAFVNLVDFAPTFLAAASIPLERACTGQSLLPLLTTSVVPADWRDAVFTQCDGVELYYTQRSVRTRDWKYVYNGFDFDELYDLRTDPGETRNLARDPAHADTLHALCARLWRFAHETDDTVFNHYWTVGLAPLGPASAFELSSTPFSVARPTG